jgi:hypothetical protein
MNDNLDKELQMLIRNHSAPQPDPGMADRIVAFATAHKQEPRRVGLFNTIREWFSPMAYGLSPRLAGMALAAILIVGLFGLPDSTTAPVHNTMVTAQQISTDGLVLAEYDPFDNTYLYGYDL